MLIYILILLYADGRRVIKFADTNLENVRREGRFVANLYDDDGFVSIETWEQSSCIDVETVAPRPVAKVKNGQCQKLHYRKV